MLGIAALIYTPRLAIRQKRQGGAFSTFWQGKLARLSEKLLPPACTVR